MVVDAGLMMKLIAEPAKSVMRSQSGLSCFRESSEHTATEGPWHVGTSLADSRPLPSCF